MSETKHYIIIVLIGGAVLIGFTWYSHQMLLQEQADKKFCEAKGGHWDQSNYQCVEGKVIK